MKYLKYFACLGVLMMCTGFVWKPQRDGKDVRLQDFCIFKTGGHTYVASMMKDFSSQGIIMARSTDLEQWEELGIAISQRTPEDQDGLWAPHVVEDAGTFYMFYTGVTQPQPNLWCQRICVASATNPADMAQWRRDQDVQFVVNGATQSWFRPDHPGAYWSDQAWADCRDPMVLKAGDTWYMFYSGTDTDRGGITGVATAPSVRGPWRDQGAVMAPGPIIPESCYVLEAASGEYVMVFNHAGCETGGEPFDCIKIARSQSLVPINNQPVFGHFEVLNKSATPGLTGWAHEFWVHPDGSLLAAYLTGYWVNLEPVHWVNAGGGWTGWTVAPLPAEGQAAP